MKLLNLDPGADPIDRLLELYCEWREKCSDVQTTYEHFATVRPSGRELAFAAYTDALDREESVALAYADQVSLVSSQLARTPSAARSIASSRGA